jgi:hypothetical protein
MPHASSHFSLFCRADPLRLEWADHLRSVATYTPHKPFDQHLWSDQDCSWLFSGRHLCTGNRGAVQVLGLRAAPLELNS